LQISVFLKTAESVRPQILHLHILVYKYDICISVLICIDINL